MFRSLLALALLATMCLAVTEDRWDLVVHWAAHKEQHGLQFDEDEEYQRFAIFADNLDYIETHNRAAAAGEHTFTLAPNQFTHLTAKEYAMLHNGFMGETAINMAQENLHEDASTVGLPTSVDWRTKGVVTGVKNQGQCGSCWSFSATGAMEAAYKLAGHSLTSLSEQNLIDCSTSYGNGGCRGGLMNFAFQYVIDNKGDDTESSYPYQTAGPLTCRFKAANVGATISSYKNVSRGSESALQNAAAQQPVSIGIDASRRSFQFYKSGVYYESTCSSTYLDHGVLLVGYGSESGSDYWLVKNSWGTGWGDNGYIKMARNRNNNCGIATQASYPVV